MKVWVIGVSAAALLGGALAMGVATQSNGTLAAGLRVAGVDVGGMTSQQALEALGTRAVTAPQVTVMAGSQSWTVGAETLGWRADAQTSIAAAERATRERGVLERVQAALGQAPVQDFPLIAGVDAAQAKAGLNTLTASLNAQPKNATILFDKATKNYTVTADAPGRKVDVKAAVAAYVAAPTLTALSIPVTEWKARYTADQLQGYVAQGNALIRPLTVQLQGTPRKAALTGLQVANLYWVRETGIVLDDATINLVFKRLMGEVNQPAQNARYALQGSKLVRVKEQPGKVAEPKLALAAFRKAITDAAVKNVVLPGKVSLPTLTLAELPDAAKLQLITTGRSTYYNSSAARRTNVANAAAKINGTVVPAGEDFSFLNSLGSITSNNGFVGGLIISGGRTVDGLGGGVCQVSTTAFRALYQAGLPVVERNQHSYRVGYYEPQVGFEAAVYDPGLDLKMKNDTGGPLLIKTINNNAKSMLEVQVWGIKPARTVTVSPAVITARTAHPAAKYVTNPNLRPGLVKQVDWAADGFNLYIARTIKDAKGVRRDKVSTIYKPWQAVFEMGPRS
ncbi:VanW family protein [Deinococcus sp. QL22]|uniref:VanW family protein n=1 Tax=Deinococcus sp. QL22 TaxID=2939437 RepID=UPI002016E87E|nr:VanW family protein [Deinococcus sp. QL22]UQN06710.1 VanW family protein [Deinococcus sp. QL22]